MANVVNTEAISKSFGERVLLDAVSLGVDDGDRIGVVGLNGGGKTTLLEILAGIEPPDSGRVSRARDVRLAVVTQRVELDPAISVRDAVLAGYDAVHEWAADPRVRSIVDGLGLAAIGLDSLLGDLSGGERRRVALAAALVRELDLLILDEPTNHLDVEGIRWLADHLLERKVALIVVTHDRWFLDTVCTRTWEVAGGAVEQYEGGYADWVYARAERARLAATAEEKRRNLARKELAWLQRGAKARTSKPRYRVEAAEALIADVPPPRDSAELHAFAKRRLGKTVLELEDVTLRIGEQTLLTDVTWRLGPGDRIGLVGVNGSGKTTLLRLLAGAREADGGRRVEGKTVRIAYLAQELEDLPGELRVLEAVEQIARRVVLGKDEMSASQLAERFGFPARRQWTPVADLSGGERRRLQLTRLLMAEPNVLLLDEPTNDLDIDTLQQLEDLLDSWPGTLVVVSHDRYLVERVCDTVVALFGDGRLTDLPGGIDEYLARRSTLSPRRDSRPAAQRPGTATAASTPSKVSAAEQRAARKELARLERKLDALHSKERELHDALAAAATDPGTLLELDAELKAVLAEKDEVEMRWLTAADSAE
ncbi:MAG: ATP-binding cassette domain-containing protein [Actinophytocola sp.]|nr:ATP-binding cassette domain-containing protein [Actinophytocola sp.]